MSSTFTFTFTFTFMLFLHLIVFFFSFPFLVARFLLASQPRNRWQRRQRRLPPGPTSLPLVGSLLSILPHRLRSRWILAAADGNDITCINLAGVHVIIVNSPELGRLFLKKHDADFASRPYTMATEYASGGYLTFATTPSEENWKKMRRVMASNILSSSRLQSQWQTKVRAEEIHHFTKFIYNQCRDGVEAINIRQAVQYYSGNLIRMMLFGVRHFGNGGKHGGPGIEEEHVAAGFTMLSLLYSFCVSDYLPWLRWLDLEGHESAMKEAVKVLDKYHVPIIEERAKKWRDGNGEEGVKGEVEDLLDVFLTVKDDDGKPLLSVEEIRAQCQVSRALNNLDSVSEPVQI